MDTLSDDFGRDGAVLLRGALDARWIDRLAEGVEINRTRPSRWAHWYTDPDESVGFWTDYVTWADVEPYRAVVFESGLADVAAALMQSRTARFFHEHVLVKEPGATERTPWHHDQPYYCVDGDQNVSMWIALDPVPASSGLRFIAGSHRWGRWFVPRRFVDHVAYADPAVASTDDRARRYELVPDLDAELDRHRLLSWDVEPGDVVAFHFRTLHDAPGNDLPTRRRAVSLRWVGDDATFSTRPWEWSPPFEPEALVPGAPLDDPRFPLVVGGGVRRDRARHTSDIGLAT
jgi:ectoine hydroxylase-related dioxygenase (phytanoyl-CoA dioxygenase family)